MQGYRQRDNLMKGQAQGRQMDGNRVRQKSREMDMRRWGYTTWAAFAGLEWPTPIPYILGHGLLLLIINLDVSSD